MTPSSGMPLEGTSVLYGPGHRGVETAARLLGMLGAEAAPDSGLDGVAWEGGAAPRRGVGSEEAEWARSGAMHLTGLPTDRPLSAPGAPATTAQGAALALEVLSAACPVTRPVSVDGPRLLGEHAAFAGLERRGAVSPNGSCHLVAASDGLVAVNLVRSEDVALLQAWLGSPVGTDPWTTVGELLPRSTATEAVERAQLLGLPVSLVPRPGEVHEDEQSQHRGWHLPPAPWRIAMNPPGRPPGRSGCEGAGLVVDLSSMWAGPLCANLLGLAGFGVVKVESVSRPDGARAGPKGFFDLLHFGHRSVALDFGDPDEIELLGRLLSVADVVIEASRPRALEQLGLGPDVVLARSPGVVWVSITGYGRDGPWRNRVAFGDDAAAAAGLLATADDGSTVFCGDAIADPLTGLHAALAAMAMVAGGHGGVIDVALRDVAASVLGGHGVEAEPCRGARAHEGDWWVDAPEGRVSVSPPGTRPVPGAASQMGTHTDEVRDSGSHPVRVDNLDGPPTKRSANAVNRGSSSASLRAGAVERVGTLGSMDVAKRVFGPGEATAFVAGGGPATDDDVSITNDGRRLDSAEAVIAFFDELSREPAGAERSSGGRG